MEGLIQGLAVTNTLSVRRHSFLTLQELLSLSDDDDNKENNNGISLLDQIRIFGGIELMVKMLSDPQYGSLHEHVIDLLSSLADNNRENQIQIMAVGGIERLVPFLKLTTNNASKLKVVVVTALWCLCNELTKDKIREAQVIAPVVALLSSEDSNSRRMATGLLCSLAYGSNDMIKADIRETDVITSLVGLLADRDVSVRFNAAATLSRSALNVSTVTSFQIRVGSGGDVEIKACHHSLDHALSLLALHTDVEHLVDESNAIQIPLTILLTDEDVLVRRKVCLVWDQLANEVCNHAMIRHTKVLPVFQTLLSDIDPEVRNTVAKILKTLSAADEINT
jgi:hypothetical protein